MLKLCVSLCVFLLSASKDIADAGICDQDSSLRVVGNVRLRLFKGNSSHFSSTDGTLGDPESIAQEIVADQRSILYVHGFMENAESENVQTIVKAYLDKADVNVILVDWGDIAIDINYVYVAAQVAVVGKAVAESLEKLGGVIDLNRLHVIGHSLGAHVAGLIGRFVNATLTRITGLDPALPLFYPSTCHIRSSDAEVVVILHTDGGFYGTPIETGTVDFYANKGISPQPGCPIIIGGVPVHIVSIPTHSHHMVLCTLLRHNTRYFHPKEIQSELAKEFPIKINLTEMGLKLENIHTDHIH